MDILSILTISSLFTVVGLVLFEVVNSADNAIINAQVLNTMTPRGRRWFLVWGIIPAVFVVRGLMPWLIVFCMMPQLGIWGSLTATFNSDPETVEALHSAAPILMMGGGVFLVLLTLEWLFTDESKQIGFHVEELFLKIGLWFYGIASTFLAVLIFYAPSDPLKLAVAVGFAAFFLTNGFKKQAERAEERLLHQPGVSDFSKILYLELIDATFSIDGVLGAFAFTISIPLILIGNGIGAIVVRQLTIQGLSFIKRFAFVKNGAMYSIGILGCVMMAEGFGLHIPEWVSPLVTVSIISYFFWRSTQHADYTAAEKTA